MVHAVEIDFGPYERIRDPTLWLRGAMNGVCRLNHGIDPYLYFRGTIYSIIYIYIYNKLET
jgi:hypothetical protein